MSVTFYGKRADGTAVGVSDDGPQGPNFSNGNAADLLDLLGLGDRELYGGEATIAEVREAVDRCRDPAGCFAHLGTRVQRLHALDAFLEELADAGAVSVYWA